MKPCAIVLAAGKGGRFGTKKQFLDIDGLPLFLHSVKKFNDLTVVVTVPKEDIVQASMMLTKSGIDRQVFIIEGGETRQESIKNALDYIEKYLSGTHVLVTDACRPLLKKETVQLFVEALKDNPAVVAVSKSINTACLVDEENLTYVIPRSRMYDLMMPQCFEFNLLKECYSKTPLKDSTDDTQIILSVYPEQKIKVLNIPFWEGIKLTYKEDEEIFRSRLKEEL